MLRHNHPRRNVLAVAGSVAVAALAGCTGHLGSHDVELLLQRTTAKTPTVVFSSLVGAAIESGE